MIQLKKCFYIIRILNIKNSILEVFIIKLNLSSVSVCCKDTNHKGSIDSGEWHQEQLTKSILWTDKTGPDEILWLINTLHADVKSKRRALTHRYYTVTEKGGFHNVDSVFKGNSLKGTARHRVQIDPDCALNHRKL